MEADSKLPVLILEFSDPATTSTMKSEARLVADLLEALDRHHRATIRNNRQVVDSLAHQAADKDTLTQVTVELIISSKEGLMRTMNTEQKMKTKITMTTMKNMVEVNTAQANKEVKEAHGADHQATHCPTRDRLTLAQEASTNSSSIIHTNAMFHNMNRRRLASQPTAASFDALLDRSIRTMEP